jgi:beta-N-acetylhexosaminidase
MAGCDIALHCSGVIQEMVEVVKAAGPLDEAVTARYRAAQRAARGTAIPIDARAEQARLDALFTTEGSG